MCIGLYRTCLKRTYLYVRGLYLRAFRRDRATMFLRPCVFECLCVCVCQCLSRRSVNIISLAPLPRTITLQNTSSTSIPMTTLILHPDPSDSTNTQDRFGNCSFSETLSSRTGTYTYIVTVSPGNIQRSSDSILIS